MAAQPDFRPKSELERHPKDKNETEYTLTVKAHAARLYGTGMKRSQVAKIMVDYLVPAASRDKPLEQKMATARAKLRRWENTQAFRDMVYQTAVVELDMSTPEILRGLSRKAKKGHVQATRLALEVTGRHNPKGDAAPTSVVVQFTGMPRPARIADIEADAEEIEDGEEA